MSRHKNRYLHRHRKFPRDLVYYARKARVEGYTPERIHRQIRGEGVTLDLTRRWVVQGRGHKDAWPEGFTDCLKRGANEWNQTKRIQQLPNEHVRMMRGMAMAGEPILDIQDHVNDLPQLRCSVTGIGPDLFSMSDLDLLLFGLQPAGWRSMPSGYRSWLRSSGNDLRRRIIDADRTLHQWGPQALSRDQIGLLARDPHQLRLHEDIRCDFDSAGVEQPCLDDTKEPRDELDDALSCESEKTNPFFWAGLIGYAIRSHNSSHRETGIRHRCHLSWTYVDDIVRASGCTRREARKAVSWLKQKVAEERTERSEA